MRRTGIDLSSTRCIVVDADTPGRRRKSGAGSLRVHHFASLSRADTSERLTAELRALIESNKCPRRAWVNLWDVPSSHQYVLLPSAPAAELESAAWHRGASVLGISAADVTVATVIGSTRETPGHQSKTEVSFFAANSHEIRQRLRPLVDAGFLVEGVTTPCGALWSQARLRSPALPGHVHAYVALGVCQSALGIFSDGSLLYARDLDWGYAGTQVGSPVPLHREELSTRLSSELRRSFLYLKQYWDEDVSQVVLCGDMPEIRSLTAPLIERLNIEVETLDTLEGINTATLPDGFADQAATFRLASSIAAEPPPVNLLPVEITADRTSVKAQRILLVGAAAAVILGAFLYAQASVDRAGAEREVARLHREIRESRANVAETDASDTHSAIARLMDIAADVALVNGVTIESLRVVSGGEYWNVAIEAIVPDVPRTGSRADNFLQELQASSAFGDPLEPPTRRVVSGQRGVNLAVTYRVNK